MEAAQPGAQPDQAAVDTAIADLKAAVSDVQTRVASDLDNLRQQLVAANEAHTSIDLTAVISEVEQIVVDVQAIDPAAALPAPGDTAAPPADTTGAPATGDQGPVSEGGAPPAPADPGAPPADTAGPPAGDGGAGDVGGGQPPSQ